MATLRRLTTKGRSFAFLRSFHASSFVCSDGKDLSKGVDDVISLEKEEKHVEPEDKFFQVTEKSILQLSKEDVGKFHAFPQSDIDKYFPEGIGKKILEARQLTGEELLLREPALDVIEKIKDWSNPGSNLSAVVLDGLRGSGKSVILNQIVNFARQSGWIVLFVPFGRKWCYEGHYVEPLTIFQGKFGIENLSVELLQQFLAAHSKELERIPARGKYGDRYLSKKDLTLEAIALFGIKNPELASTAIVDLREELGKVTEFPVLIAIDEYNSWFGKTAFQYKYTPVLPDDIAPIHALKDLDENGLRQGRELANGFRIFANSGHYSDIPGLCKKATYSQFKQNVPMYTTEEIQKIFAFYSKKGYAEFGIPSNLSYVKFMTGANPETIFRTAFDFFVPESNSKDFDFELLLPS